MTDYEKVEEIRTEIKKLQNERELAILEKGFAANANEDLRENAQYDYWLEKEFYLTGKIKVLLEQVNQIQLTHKRAKPKKKVNKEKISDTTLTQKHKWL